jgi:hypothetical protein
MQSKSSNQQKSLARRFLLVLRFVVFCGIGLFIILDHANIGLVAWQCYLLGGVFIAYAFLRLITLIKRNDDEP